MHPAHGDVLAVLGAALTSFLATNLDALAILTTMLWSTRPARRRYPILIGCSVGNAAVLALALLAAAGLEVVPEDELRWVGIVPIMIGVYRLLPRRGSGSGRAREGRRTSGAAGADELIDSGFGLGSAAFVDTGSGRIPPLLVDGGDSISDIAADSTGPVALLDGGNLAKSRSTSGAGPVGPRQDGGAVKALFAHAGLTVALGGDNIAVLAPLFRALGTGGSAVIAMTHFVLFPLLLAVPALANRSNAEVPRLARPASACLSIVIGTVIVAG